MIGLGYIFGTLIEPVTRQPRSWSPTAGLAIGLNLAASAALIAAGLRHSATARARVNAAVDRDLRPEVETGTERFATTFGDRFPAAETY